MAFDSLHSVPLAGATVRIMGRSSVSVSDARGRFKFDSVAPGAYQLVLEHAELDSIGLTELATRVVVDGQQRDVTIAIPSFATLWQRTCGTGRHRLSGRAIV
ncbi:MAG: carboxypeptidase-like regulatory domain-containing protein, partial [Gemmatimonadaceae bacterium]